MTYVTSVEAAYLRMIANRVREYERKAQTENELYVHYKRPLSLACGYRVHLKFEGETPVAAVYPDEELTKQTAQQIASELLKCPAKLRGKVGDVLEFVPRDTAPDGQKNA